MSDESLQSTIDKYWWYHSIDLGNGVVTPGHFGNNLIAVMRLLKSISVEGYDCLDVGTMDGLMAFELEKRGASRVVATDLEERKTVYFLQKHFGSHVEYTPGVSIDTISQDLANTGRFDLVVCSGVLYHIYSPLRALISLRHLLKPGGLILIESACIDSNDCTMHFNNEGRLYDDPTTFWLPSVGCLRYMLALACMVPVRETSLEKRGDILRYAVLCEAKRPSEMPLYDTWLYSIHRNLPVWARDFLKPLDLADWDKVSDESTIAASARCMPIPILSRRRRSNLLTSLMQNQVIRRLFGKKPLPSIKTWNLYQNVGKIQSPKKID